MSARPDFAGWLWRALTYCPPTSLIWASLGYRLGLIDGREQVRRELLADLAQAGARWHEYRPGGPTHAELQARRGEPADQMRRNLAQPVAHRGRTSPRTETPCPTRPTPSPSGRSSNSWDTGASPAT